MIQSRLSTIMGSQRMKQTELARKTGLSYQTVHSLYHAKTDMMALSTLDALCRALGVQVGDLLVYVPDGEE
jgi:putative transcriptional regulator